MASPLHAANDGRASVASMLAIAAIALLCITALVWFAFQRTKSGEASSAAAPMREAAPSTPAYLGAGPTHDADELVADSRVTEQRSHARPPDARASTRASVELQAPSPVHARCEFIALDVASRLPIEGARFDIRPAPASTRTPSAARDTAPPTTAVARAAAARATVSAAGYATESAEVEWHAHEFARHAIELGRCAPLRVTCRGTLPAAATLSIERVPRLVPIAQPLRYLARHFDISAVAPAHGLVEADQLPGDCKLAVAVHAADGSLLSAVEYVELDPARVTELELRVFTVAAVRGRLVRADGMWIRNCGMIAVATTIERRQVLTGASEAVARTTTDRFGYFEFRSLPAGLWLIGPDPRAFTARGGKSGKPVPLAEVLNTIVLPPPDLFEVKLPAGFSISGVARNEHGKALPDVLFCYRAPVEGSTPGDDDERPRWTFDHTDADGAFEIERLLPGEYDLSLAEEPTSVVRVPAGTSNVELCSAPRGVAGRVLVPAGTSPMTSRVAVIRNATLPGDARVFGTRGVGVDGEFSIPTGARGDLIVVAAEPNLGLVGFARCSRSELEFFAHVEIELRPACRLALRRARDDTSVAFGLADGWVLPQIAEFSPAREWLDLPMGEFTLWRRAGGDEAWSAAQTLTARAGATLDVEVP